MPPPFPPPPSSPPTPSPPPLTPCDYTDCLPFNTTDAAHAHCAALVDANPNSQCVVSAEDRTAGTRRRLSAEPAAYALLANTGFANCEQNGMITVYEAECGDAAHRRAVLKACNALAIARE